MGVPERVAVATTTADQVWGSCPSMFTHTFCCKFSRIDQGYFHSFIRPAHTPQPSALYWAWEYTDGEICLLSSISSQSSEGDTWVFMTQWGKLSDIWKQRRSCKLGRQTKLGRPGGYRQGDVGGRAVRLPEEDCRQGKTRDSTEGLVRGVQRDSQQVGGCPGVSASLQPHEEQPHCPYTMYSSYSGGGSAS